MGLRCALVAAPLLALALAAAPPSLGATVSVFVPACSLEQSKYGQCYPDEAQFKADPGEANRLTISHGVGSGLNPAVSYHDDGAPVTAGSGCSQVDAHTASCTGYLITAVV